MQRFERDVETELVAVSEAVHHGAGRGGDAKRHPQRRPADHAVGKHRSGESHDAHPGRRVRGLAGLAVEGDPGLVRRLGADVVESKRRQQAHDRIRDGRGDHRDRLDLRGFDLRESIEAVAQILHDAIGNQALQPAMGDPERNEVSWPEVGADTRVPQLRCIQ